jgi:hypothetical protein
MQRYLYSMILIQLKRRGPQREIDIRKLEPISGL